MQFISRVFVITARAISSHVVKMYYLFSRIISDLIILTVLCEEYKAYQSPQYRPVIL
jgi:hypothetical protein